MCLGPRAWVAVAGETGQAHNGGDGATYAARETEPGVVETKLDDFQALAVAYADTATAMRLAESATVSP